MASESLKHLCSGLPLSPLPENRGRTEHIAHASRRNIKLAKSDQKVFLFERALFDNLFLKRILM
jgi:hypothetical protein